MLEYKSNRFQEGLIKIKISRIHLLQLFKKKRVQNTGGGNRQVLKLLMGMTWRTQIPCRVTWINVTKHLQKCIQVIVVIVIPLKRTSVTSVIQG